MKNPRVGASILEVLVGTAILLAVLVPLMQRAAGFAFSGRARDRQVAAALLRGEAEVVYATLALPAASREVLVEGVVYEVACTTETAQEDLSRWRIEVRRRNRSIASASGLLWGATNTAHDTALSWEGSR